MNPINPVNSSLISQALNRADTLRDKPALPAHTVTDGMRASGAGQSGGFGQMLDGLVSNVTSKQTEAGELTRRVLMGESDQLHQSIIAMQEAGVAFTMMVEVRNKLVESYQELMRMQL